ncbi:MAG: FeoA domain-containing protein, partial [Spirochaetaceae bacterium]|nr:FeoA domain-containing protein [Spirochaetaceae bacterium]
MKLSELKEKQSAKIIKIGGEGALRQHLLDMGLIPDVWVTMVKRAPLGDPMELRLHGYELTLRLADADKIEIDPNATKPVKEPMATREENKTLFREIISDIKDSRQTEHPGLGETGKFHKKNDGNPLPKNQTLTFALAGNQNCGKTTLFNQ